MWSVFYVCRKIFALFWTLILLINIYYYHKKKLKKCVHLLVVLASLKTSVKQSVFISVGHKKQKITLQN